MSKRTNNKRGNRVSGRKPNKECPCKVRGGYHGGPNDHHKWLENSILKELRKQQKRYEQAGIKMRFLQ